MNLIKTMMMKQYIWKLWIRISVFIFVLAFYFYDKELMLQLAYQPIHLGVNVLHILWAMFMLMMVGHIFPKEPFTMALLKREKKTFIPVENSSRLELLEFVQDQN